ncbi:hypothetical protein B0H14DRAFT_1071569 [Mycena olivaceomarginata]|nr:hypothetical protein B0H14DRAFT_1071569 [Mycena olivaceomarginata]
MSSRFKLFTHPTPPSSTLLSSAGLNEQGKTGHPAAQSASHWETHGWRPPTEFRWRTFSFDALPGRQGDPELEEMLPLLFDNMWLRINVALWKFSNELDRSGDEGTVAKKFGLFDPADPERPSCMQTALKEIGALLSDLLRPHSDPPPPPSENIPTVESTVAASGHAYVSETRHLRAKEKVKTKGSALRTDLELADEEEEEILSESLPADFKIGKKKH